METTPTVQRPRSRGAARSARASWRLLVISLLLAPAGLLTGLLSGAGGPGGPGGEGGPGGRSARSPRPSLQRGRRERLSDRGDVPGWVLITMMTAGLVVALWALAGEAFTSMFQDSMNKVGGGG